MKIEKPDDMSVKNYLLGTLSDLQTEQMDELSVADDDFAERLRAHEHDLVDSYVNGELDGPELARFEAHYLASPWRREKVEVARGIQRLGAADSGTHFLANEKETEPKRSFFSGLFGPVLQWGLAAAVILLAVVTVFLWSNNRRLKQQVEETASITNASQEKQHELERQLQSIKQAGDQTNQDIAAAVSERDRLQAELDQAKAASPTRNDSANRQAPVNNSPGPFVASFALTPSLRDNGQPQRISIPANTARVAFHLKLEPNDFSSFRAILKDPNSGSTLWQSGTLKAAKRGQNSSLAVSLPARLLSSKIYTISLSGISADNTKELFSDYTFQVVR